MMNAPNLSWVDEAKPERRDLAAMAHIALNPTATQDEIVAALAELPEAIRPLTLKGVHVELEWKLLRKDVLAAAKYADPENGQHGSTFHTTKAARNMADNLGREHPGWYLAWRNAS